MLYVCSRWAIEHPLEKRLFGALLQDMLYGNGVLGCAVPTLAHAERLAGFLVTDLGRRITELTLVCVLGPILSVFDLCNCFVNFCIPAKLLARAEK